MIKYKKLIAKEILILVIVSFVSFIVISLVVAYENKVSGRITFIMSAYPNVWINGVERWSPEKANLINIETNRRETAEAIGKYSMWFLWGLIYPARILFYIIKWAIKTVREPNPIG